MFQTNLLPFVVVYVLEKTAWTSIIASLTVKAYI